MGLYSSRALKRLWVEAGGAPEAAAIAAAVALAESGGNERAVSSTGDFGLWQINARAHPQYDSGALLYARTNAEAAVAISSDGTDWKPWCTAYTDAACGTKGGVYAPFGTRDAQGRTSPSAQQLAVVSAGGQGAASYPADRNNRQRVLAVSATDQQRLEAIEQHLTAAWHEVSRAVAATIPTRMHLARRLARGFARDVRGPSRIRR